MPGRLIGFLASLGAAAGCYSPPEPDCGFVCGPGGACPADYTCASDHHCHRNDAAASLVCGTPPADAAPDVPPADVPPAPHVVSTTPVDGATNVGVDATVAAFADQPLAVDDQGLVLLDGTTQVPGSLQVLDMELQLIPGVQLAANHHFTVQITTGVTNYAGEPLGPYQWSFDTGADTIPPHVQSSAPSANDTGVSVTTGIRVTFDEEVQSVDGASFTALDGSTPVAGSIVQLDPRTYELQPTSSLSPSSTITVSLSGAIVDASNNALAPTTYSFTTAP
jgi:hypothetical protein